MPSSAQQALRTFDAKSIFTVAEQFRMSADILFQQWRDHHIQVVPPSFTCRAFSLELYLKTLLTIERGGYPQSGHNLESYMEPLSIETKNKIRDYTNMIAVPSRKKDQELSRQRGFPAPPDFDYDTALKASANAFVNWRYVYEGNFKPAEGWQGGEIIQAVRRIILEHHPDWASA